MRATVCGIVRGNPSSYGAEEACRGQDAALVLARDHRPRRTAVPLTLCGDRQPRSEDADEPNAFRRLIGLDARQGHRRPKGPLSFRLSSANASASRERAITSRVAATRSRVSRDTLLTCWSQLSARGSNCANALPSM